MLSQGFLLMTPDPLTGELIPAVPAQLPPAKVKEVQAMATALFEVWQAWQTGQVVEVPGSSPGTLP